MCGCAGQCGICRICRCAVTACQLSVTGTLLYCLAMDSGVGGERGEDVLLVELATELVHKVALSGWLEFEDVKALAMTCKRMKSIFVDDDYGRDIHYALKGVVENVRGKRWRSARFAVKRKWFVDWREKEESVWREVAKTVLAERLRCNRRKSWQDGKV